MESNFQLWLKGCTINGSVVFHLEDNGRFFLYKVFNEYLVNNNYYRNTPVFFVWDKENDVNICNALSYREAYLIFEKYKTEYPKNIK